MSEIIYEVENISFRYPGYERDVLNGASISLHKGEILCILGPNGAGKTTLLSCMAGLLKPFAGTIRLCGRDLTGMSEKETARLVGFVPQMHVPSFDYRVIDFVLMGRAPHTGLFSRPTAAEEQQCMEVLENMGLAHIAEKSYLDISGGERQQLLIARAIIQSPEAILFDEPTAHLDYGNQHRTLSRIKQMASEGYSVVITTHNPDHALLLGDQAAIVSEDGTVTQGATSDILTEEILSEVYGMDIRIRYIEELGRTACLVPGL
ncbi:MAG: ABC transporter ATP-binding protein [Mogibacterium sp.]|nr:ABC transporter ATP-binding protein [Mogibacterium sp.]